MDPSGEILDAATLARRLGVTVRTLHNYVAKHGLRCCNKERRRLFSWPDVFRWHTSYIASMARPKAGIASRGRSVRHASWARLNPSQREGALQLFREGRSVREVSSSLGVHTETMYRLLRNAGIPLSVITKHPSKRRLNLGQAQ
jgi:DNA-binding CsgD family transcriptional regulator